MNNLNGWIDINEKMPEDHEFQYLFWNSEIDNYEILDSCVALNKYERNYNDDFGMSVISDQPYYIEKGITHWRELPAPPEPSARWD